MKAKTTARIEKLKIKIGEGCPACRHWPHCWILGEDDPEPPMRCGRCRRRYEGGVRIYVGVDPDAI